MSKDDKDRIKITNQEIRNLVFEDAYSDVDDIDPDKIKTVIQAKNACLLKWEFIRNLLMKAENEAGGECGFCYLVGNYETAYCSYQLEEDRILDPERSDCPVSHECATLGKEALTTINEALKAVTNIIHQLNSMDVKLAQKKFNQVLEIKEKVP